MNLIIEIIAVVLNLIYLLLLIKERIACWFFGISASFISIYLFYLTGLYSEAVLYVYYVVIGFYGYNLWKKNQVEGEELKIRNFNFSKHLMIVVSGIITATLVGYLFKKHSNAVNPYFDAFTTVFSFIASFLEANKILSSWIFWIMINALTILLYTKQSLFFYSFLTIVYTTFSFIGYFEWRRKYRILKLND